MASRRLAGSSVDWAEFVKKIPDAQRASFNALKNKTDGYVRQISALPEKKPAIDWATYKGKIAVAGMVDDFQKKYDALDVPYPKDTLASAIEQQAREQKSQYEKFVAESKTRVAGIDKEKAKWEAMMPVEEMNLEEALKYVPQLVKHVDPNYTKNKVSLWPHDEDYEEWRKQIDELKARGDVEEH